MKRNFTEPQKKALMSLSRDGAINADGGKLSMALNSLCLYHPDLAVSEWGEFGPRGGRKRGVRLTDAGRDYIAEHLPETQCP